MWNYEKRLQYPINITTPNAKIAQIIMSQYGGPDGEMGASMRYLSQRYSMPDRRVCGVLTDIGTEELAHRCWILKIPSPEDWVEFFSFTIFCYIYKILNHSLSYSLDISISLYNILKHENNLLIAKTFANIIRFSTHSFFTFTI